MPCETLRATPRLFFPRAGSAETTSTSSRISRPGSSLDVASQRGAAAKVGLGVARAIGARRILDGLLRLGPHGLSVAKLKEAPHGLDLGPLVPRLPELLAGRPVKIAPRVFLEDLPRLRAKLEADIARGERNELLLVGRRDLRSNNSWMHNVTRLTKGKPACTLLMHPDDARIRDVRSGDMVKLKSRTGEVRVPLEVSDEIARGVVSLPHGWGHQKAHLRVAQAQAGVSANDVTDETFLDGLTGTAAFNGVPVEVS